MNQKISVIVPIYNVENYLNRCIKSIVNQTYRDLEIILVDDGSTDHCGEMCDTWKEKDERIKVVHKSNGGLSDARNMGMEVCTGNYIAFVDSDDWLDASMYEQLMKIMVQNKCDIVSCGFRRVEKEELKNESKEVQFIQYNSESALEAMITENEMYQVVWNKLYKRSMVEDILFEKGKYNEDEFWSYQVIGRAKKVIAIKNIYYNYFQRENSIINETYSLKRLDGLEGKENRQEYIDKYYPRLSGIARLNLFYSYMYAYQCSLRLLNKEDLYIAKEKIEDGLKTLGLKYADYHKESLKHKIGIIMCKISMRNVCRLRNKFKIGL